MGVLIDRLERLVFGATAAERVELLVTLAAQRVERRLAAALEPDADDAADVASDVAQQTSSSAGEARE